VIEQNTRTRIEAVILSRIDSDPMTVQFGNTVRTAGIKPGRFRLRRIFDHSEQFAGGSLIEAECGIDHADRLKHTRNPERNKFPGQHRLAPGCWDKGLSGEVVTLVRSGLPERTDQ
jgi:hypothetical protein